MGLFNFFKRQPVEVEQKGFYPDDMSDVNLSNILGMSTNTSVYVTPLYAYHSANKNADLGKAINSTTKAIASLKKNLTNEKTDEIIYNSPVLDLLNKPCGNMSRFQFWQEIAESWQLTQEIFIVARGNINRPPLELEFIRPYDVNISMGAEQSDPETILTCSGRDRRVYKKQRINGMVRYIDSTGLNELFAIRGKISIIDDWRGRSPLSALYYDLLMNTDGKRHNSSLLKNGMTTSGMITPPDTEKNSTWTETQFKSIVNQLRSFNQGAGNAGNVLVLSKPAKLSGMTQSNKDMDFVSLLSKSQDAIYNLYDIPLPLVKNEAMTYDNYTTANRMFYTEAVIPVYNQIAEGIMANLRPRYNLDSSIVLSFDMTQIMAMQTVLLENMVKMTDTKAVSPNEVRRVGGFEDVPGGDTIFINANVVPLSVASSDISFEGGSDDTSTATKPSEPGEEID